MGLDYTLSDLPRLMTAFSERFILHTWYCPWGSYSARIPRDKKICSQFETLTVEKLAQD